MEPVPVKWTDSQLNNSRPGKPDECLNRTDEVFQTPERARIQYVLGTTGPSWHLHKQSPSSPSSPPDKVLGSLGTMRMGQNQTLVQTTWRTSG